MRAQVFAGVSHNHHHHNDHNHHSDHNHHHNDHNNHNKQAQKVCAFLLCYRSVEPSGRLVDAWRTRRRMAEQTATQSVAMALSAAAHHSYDKMDPGAKYDGPRATGPGRLRTELYGDRSLKQPGMRCSSSCLTKTQRGCGPGFSPSLARRSGSRGAPWITLSTSSVVRPWCRSLTLLCRRLWNSCQTCSSSSTRSRPIPFTRSPR